MHVFKLSLLLAATIFLSQNASADLQGDLTLDNGKSTIRISVGDQQTGSRHLVDRIRRLERAVMDLQDTVYELSQTNVGGEAKFICNFMSCRKSDSVMNNSKHNCAFFDGYKIKKLSTWSTGPSLAEEKVKAILDSDRDVVDYNSVTCDYE